MRDLIALDMPASNSLVKIINSIWDSNDGFAPIDQRLPQSGKAALIKALAPSKIIYGNNQITHLPNAQPLEENQSLAMATSGTTGNPKIVMYTRQQLDASAIATSRHIGVNDDDKWLCCLPISHIGGLSVILRSLITNTNIEIHNGFKSEEVIKSAKNGATLTSLVPTTLARIDPLIFRKIILGGSNPPPDLPPNTLTTYGLTETGSGVVYDGSPLPGVEISIGQGDEILLRGPMIATHFRSGSLIVDSNGWLHTKDAGAFENNRLKVFGRIDDMINTGGEKVFPQAIESLILSFIEIDKVAIISLPDQVWGEAVTAVIVAKPDHRVPSLDELRERVKEKLPAYCAPTRMLVVDKVPTTALGKIQKTILRNSIIQDQNL